MTAAALPAVSATLAHLADPAFRVVSERYEGFQAGGGGKVAKPAVRAEHAEASVADGKLRLRLDHPGRPEGHWGQFRDFPRTTLIEGTSEVLGLPRDWTGYACLRATVRADEAPVTVDLTVVGARGRLTEARTLTPGQTETWAVGLDDVPLVQGNLPAREPTGVRFAFQYEAEGPPRAVTVESLTLEPGPVAPCVDRFGQRRSADWPGKARGVDDLRHALQEERGSLPHVPPVPDRSRFGGWTGGPRFEATGFFRVVQDDNGRWWYADPEGHPFLSFGCTGVRPHEPTRLTGRAGVFEDPPPAEDDPEFGSNLARFYQRNVIEKHGSLEAWRDHVLARFRAWGYNTIANWSHPVMLDQRQVPHVQTIETKQPAECQLRASFYDVFDPRWVSAMERICADTLGPERDNPWMLGIFVDNEKPWRGMRLLEAGPDAALRDEWLALVRKRHDSLESFNREAGTTCADWNDVRRLREDDLTGPGAAGLSEALEDHYTEAYFRIIRDMVKRHAPNHLYLGCRYVSGMPRENLIAIAGKYVDVLSVNCYSLVPERDRFDAWHAVSGGRPIQIGEHQLPQCGPRQAPPLYPSFSAEERRKYYPAYDREVASWPYGIGSHWFQHCDQPLTGRARDGENQTIGIVDITDRPHPEMVEAVREIADNMYAWHAAAT